MKINFSLIYIFILIFFLLNLFLILDRREIKISNMSNINYEIRNLTTKHIKNLIPITKENKDIDKNHYFYQSLSFIDKQKKSGKEVVFELLNYDPIEKSSFIFGAYPIKEGFKNSINFKKYLIAKSTVEYDELLFFLNFDKHYNYNCKILMIDNIPFISGDINKQIRKIKQLTKIDHMVKVIYECY